MSQVIVGFDASPAATAALRWAADEAQLRRATLIAYTINDRDAGLLLPPSPRLTDGYPVSVRRGAGDVATRLRAACTPDDLLVIGTRARPTVNEIVLGSVSRACLTHAPCPVVVIRTPEQVRRFRRWVIAALRSSTGARHTLVTAATEARLRGAGLIAVHAERMGNVDAELFPAATARVLEQGREWLVAQVASAGVRAVPEVVVGPAGEALVRRSDHQALLVLGAHESSAPWGGVPGATIAHCIRRASCPVMVVPPIPASEAPLGETLRMGHNAPGGHR